MCLAPLWRAYASLDDGSDIAATLGKMMAKLSLAQVRARRPDLQFRLLGWHFRHARLFEDSLSDGEVDMLVGLLFIQRTKR